MSKTNKQIQQRLADLGYYKGLIDGRIGPVSRSAIRTFQDGVGLKPDGIVGPLTLATLFPIVVTPGSTKFDKSSMNSLKKAHVDLQKVLMAARELTEFRVLDSTRGEKAQTLAYNTGKSKAKFGQSAHNYEPAIAVDLFPAPYSWKDINAFLRMGKIVLATAAGMGVPLRWGGDWHMDGDRTKSDDWDKPHFELHPWRQWAQNSKLVRP